MLRLENISKTYNKRRVLSGVNHEFAQGVNLLVGPSGAGKSTLLRLCATVEKPSGGAMTWNGQAYSKSRRQIRRSLGYAPQSVDMPPDISGREFLSHMAALKGVGRESRDQVTALLSQLGLSADADQRIAAWSGGMRRRLILAQALLGKPSLLALDEPTAELDKVTAGRVSDIINHVAESATVIITTHLVKHFDVPSYAVLTLPPAHGNVK